MKQTCVFCGQFANAISMKRMNPSKTMNTIMVATLSLIGVVDRADVDTLVEQISKHNKYLCHSHVAYAAQYLASEMLVMGRRFSYYHDPSSRGSTAYFNTSDIPAHIVEAINSMTNSNISIRDREVMVYVNNALRKYHGTPLWPEHYEEEEGQEEELLEPNFDVAGPSSLPEARTELEVVSKEDVGTTETDDEDDDVASTQSAQVSEYVPSGSSSESSTTETLMNLGETDEADMQKYFLVKGEKLLKLFRFCPECGHTVGRKQLKPVGTAAVVRFVCEICSIRSPPVKRWESQDRLVPHSRERKFKGNVVAAVSAITTGLRYVALARWAQQTKLAMFSKTFFFEVFQWTKPAIESVYLSQQKLVLEMIARKYKGAGLHLATDGAYDSRGFSALICRVVLADTQTKLVLHTEVLHRSETENVSTRMEVEGTKRALRWAAAQGLQVSSVTTDRSRRLGAAIRELAPEVGVIRHYYDGWHLVKWLGNRLREAAKVDDCGDIAEWTEKVKTHLWTSIERGAASGLTRPIFNTCLMHIRGVHQWPLNDLTGPFTSCSHKPLQGPRPEELEEDSKVYRKFRDVVLTNSFQLDLLKAGPHGGTSVCEAKHSLDRAYCPKETFFPIETYPLYVKMATMHMNTLRLAEGSGERRVLKTREIQRKYLNRKSKLVLKSPAKHVWRDFVLEEVLRNRLTALQAKGPTRTPQWVVDLMEAEEEYEWEL